MATLGLYALKPWWTRRLEPVLTRLDGAGVHPDAVTLGGVLCAAAAAGAIAAGPSLRSALVAGLLLVARLGCANLDGTLARRRTRDSREARRGALWAELADRVADLLPLAGLALAGAPTSLVLLAALASSAPAFVSLAGLAAGHPERLQTGPAGKTERCLIVALAAGGPVVLGCWVLAVAGLVTAGIRAAQVAR